ATQRLIEDRSLRNIAYWPDLMDAKHRFKELTGKLINSAAENIAVTSSTSMGLNWLAQGLEWHPGDRILLNNFEFPANVYPFLNLQRSGVQVDFVEHREGIIRVEDLAAKIRPETRLLSISFVEFLNGYRNDLKQIGELCAQNDIIFCVDSIQGIGALQLDVQELNIDFVA
ncbi:MAG: aminotransferase class V-fold PLP-dependent enzyme, partial [Calditrichae bacterium]|nr:aminotransferase class V-fold PLP-dependent enzyme [Calditrichia bacterium]NIW79771.1 aminotransferase class V-fold PLP-dependent enzyme [Calditrichia bacterium]